MMNTYLKLVKQMKMQLPMMMLYVMKMIQLLFALLFALVMKQTIDGSLKDPLMFKYYAITLISVLLVQIFSKMIIFCIF